METDHQFSDSTAIEMRDMGFNLIVGPNGNLGCRMCPIQLTLRGGAYGSGHGGVVTKSTTCGFAYNYFPVVSLAMHPLRPLMMQRPI